MSDELSSNARSLRSEAEDCCWPGKGLEMSVNETVEHKCDNRFNSSGIDVFMAYQEPQKGNPHKLTLKQHVFPRRSIERFYGSRGGVELYLPVQQKRIRARANHNVFYAERAWLHRVESGFMADIERRYQEVADAIVRGSTTMLSAADHRVITDMFALWKMRWHWQDSHRPDPKIKMHSPERVLTLDEEERLEKAGVLFFKADGTFPVRQAVGVRIHLDQEELANRMSGRPWGIVRAEQGQFVVPDTFGVDAILPLSPTIFLAWDAPDKTIPIEGVALVNQVAFVRHRRYLFAECLDSAPL